MSKCGDSYDTVCPPSVCDCRAKTLTDKEINEIIKQQDWFSMSWVDMVRRIEDKIRNG